ncbi:hypothetical protein [Mycoplasma suis]|uniref:Uncharacterized protein n=1 Tax=Mycoplasma suis (strain Illinois) TaxID=768700 RepID=F0QS36_MYCSL|nr:hypothetical protein [Mycoplasma suis]ADX98306.1 hypothetical protein MSU_0781 [Mycoplasma suis str. Illinois]
MRKISESEKKLIVGGAGRRRYSPLSSKPKSGIVNCNTRFHNISLLALSSIPGLITLGEEIYSFFFGDKGNAKQVSSHFSPVGSGYYGNYSGGGSNASNRRDFFSYASEALRPTIRFSPYYYKSGISFGVPWAV